MLIDGAIIMAIGMGTVFVFLGLMVLLMTLLARVMKKFPTTDMKSDFSAEKSGDSCCAGAAVHEEIAAVIAAVKAFAKEAGDE
jgi:sodium pump decarboxylase gamma subunit